MTTRWHWILGGGLALYFVGVGFLGAAVLTQHHEAVRTYRSYLVDPELQARARPEASNAPWTTPLWQVDQALAQTEVSAAEQAWLDAFVAALKSRRWEGMLEVGDAYLRLARLGGFSKTAETKARQIYLAALFRARQQGSVDGVLRTAEAFARLGDHRAVARCLRIAESLAAQARDAQAHERVRVFKERLPGISDMGSFSPPS